MRYIVQTCFKLKWHTRTMKSARLPESDKKNFAYTQHTEIKKYYRTVQNK